MTTTIAEKPIAHAGADISPRCAVSPGSAGWVRGDAPKDGKLYVALGRMVGTDEWGGHSTPFLSHVRWGGSGDWSGWVDEHGMAISSDIEDRVYIDHWCALPNTSVTNSHHEEK